MDEYELLVKNGNIGIYNSCEITELVIMEPNEIIYNLYTLCVFQEKNVSPEKHKYNRGLCNRIEIDENHSIGIFQYELMLTEIKENFEKLIGEYKWISNHKDESSINYADLRRLNKQFIPSNENRLNYILKNNFYSGSYILEFFDEKKKFEYLTDDEENFEKISNKINKRLPIDLFKIRDRLGNFIFQFPVNILNVKTKVASDSWDSLNFNINWHHLINENCPDCILEVNSLLDNNYIGNSFEEYNKKDSQVVFTGNVDSVVSVKILRKNPKLLLYSDSGHYVKNFGLFTFMDVQKKRYFINNDKEEIISLKSNDYSSIIQKQEYYQYIENSIGINEKKELEKTLSFKQYTPEHDRLEGLNDLRRLIQENGMDGAYLWDPYLSFNEIIDTLFHCPFEGVILKALGSEKLDKDLLDQQKSLFSNLNTNFKGLNLEFRVQKGNGAHDRFLIFPGNSKTYKQPKVYSLGTSVNSFGRRYHILQEVLHPQAVVREFDKIWNESEENSIWKYPN